MKFEELEKKIGRGAAIAVYYSDSKNKLLLNLEFADLIDAYKETLTGSGLRKIFKEKILRQVKYDSSFRKQFQVYQTFTDDPKLKKRILKKLVKSAEDLNDWMDIYCELETGDDLKPKIERKMLKVADNLEKLFTLYYVIQGESELEEVFERISAFETGIEEWAEIFTRIPQKKEFSKIREIFISKMSKLVEK